ncbi:MULTISPECIES: hypothetical protein [unclassified Duganella]|uniref:hypothetical protein n=1 Tax=unclassified Duganella TaxID=2636909 RepID=UPI0006F70300|nr:MULTISPECIES: hypothetical protein [unclassified Duganella]KQV45361.1 hypothetical protein ASD07_17755 [Duganella sp. Root336D2]
MKRSLLVLGVFGLCWIGAVWYWRTTTRMPDTGDLTLAMLVMPLTLIMGFVLARKTFAAPEAVTAGAGGAQAPATPELQAGRATQGSGDAHGAANVAHAAAPWMQFAVAGTALRMAHGDSPAELAAAIAEGEARLDLDPELTDLQGFPLLAGRVADIALGPLEEWLSSLQPAPRTPSAQHLRAMALGGDIAARLAAQASESGSDGVLQLIPLLPQDWPATTQVLATRWLEYSITEAGWPLEQLAVRQPAAAAHAFASAVPPAPATTLAALRAVSAQAAGADAPALNLLLACGSDIDADAVENLAVNGKLYGARNPNGRMPAEGAAGILLQSQPEAGEELRLLALHAKEDATLRELAQEALVQADGAKPAYVAADTDHRAALMSDLMQCVEAAVPGLDANTSLACVGASCGHTGAVGALAAIALAHHQAMDSSGIALALANSDPTQRYALLVGPLPAPASKAPSLS